MEYLVTGARALLALVFLVSFVSKITGPAAFTGFLGSVRAMGVTSPALLRPVAHTVIAAEAAVCVLLALPARKATTAGLLVAAVLLTAFTAGIAAAVRRGATAPCRCFGASTTPVGVGHIVRNSVLCAVAVTGALAGPAAGAAGPGGLVVAAIGGTVVGAVVTQLDHVLALFRPLPRDAARERAADTGRRPGRPAGPARNRT
ncbi:MauE/DoxX family redox-associated membrane protein [Streptomyces sp. NPDC023723]|uniref:MauE/DoxX family redox-associated membrane protein n=1 Tax=Streptomyces sp. NPDC023723 TaxID=3154323 RepID=UPI0033E201BD